MTRGWTILHAGALGDLILSLHFFECVRKIVETGSPGEPSRTRAARDLDVTLVSRTDPGDLRRCGRGWRRVSMETVGAHRLYEDAASEAPPAALVDLARDRRVLNLLSGPDAAPHRRLCQLAAAAVISVDPRPDGDSTDHITTQWLRRAADSCELRAWRMEIEAALAERVSGGLTKCPAPRRGVVDNRRRTALIHPGAGAADKCWPLECFLRVAGRLKAAGRSTRFIVGEVERERWPPAALARIRTIAPLTVAADIHELRGELDGCAALLGNDSGPAHLAAWQGAPVLALYGPTDARVWRPIGARVRVLQGEPRAGDDWNLNAEDVACELLGLLDAARAS